MSNYDEVIVTLLFFSLLGWEYLTGLYERNRRPPGDWAVDGISFLQLPLIKPAVMLMAFVIGVVLFPGSRNSLNDLPFWLGFLVVFIPDDFSHYWIHRMAHDHPWLWGFHRTHHATNVYQTSIAFRENWLWFWIMPGFWWTGLMIYFGLLEEVILSTAIIGIHNVWLHNGSTWDRRLYQNRFTRGPMKLLEYFLNTPGLHRGHHGLGENGVPMGNYAQTLFIWDVLFKTATFNEGKLPEYYGTMHPETMQQRWYYHLWWPLFKEQSCATIELDTEQ